MAGLKELRNRLESIRSTQKITSAMKLVAASRLRKAQTALEKNRPYAESLNTAVRRILASLHEEEIRKNVKFVLPALLRPITNAHRYLLIVLSSDRGLCGSYNQNVGKAAIRRMKELESTGAEVRLLCFGRKAYDILKKKYADRILDHQPSLAAKGLNQAEANDLLKRAEDFVSSGQFDVCEMLYSRFRSAISRELTICRVWPLGSELTESSTEDRKLICVGDAYYDFKPNPMLLLDALLPRLLANNVYSAIANAQASEQGARMAAMDNATRNAKEMIGTLTLKYNSIRQSAITTELTEIISGAEAI